MDGPSFSKILSLTDFRSLSIHFCFLNKMCSVLPPFYIEYKKIYSRNAGLLFYDGQSNAHMKATF